jgi:ABC-type sugar transport system ATPase subunit/ribose/xylose/arabinose/galactoside ABC-type transport system permease subunit
MPDMTELAAARAHTELVTPIGLYGATKRFGGTVAIADVTFDLRSGEVLALLGENGAGKSTCVKLLAGIYRPDTGDVRVDGHQVEGWSPHVAQRRGVAVMHQHPGLFPDLAVFENIFIGHMPRASLGAIDRARMRVAAVHLLDAVGLSCRPETLLKSLRTAEQQLVEIARALSVNARVLIMDEPTAALSQREVERLFAVVASLRARSVALLFVGHRMEEIYRVADRIAVLRDGRLVGLEPAALLDRDRAVQLMVGRPLAAIYPSRTHRPGAVVLGVRGLTRRGVFADISFEVRTGEILGLAGLVGSGRTEIARVLFGIDRADDGTIELNDRQVAFADPAAAMAAGIAYISEDRLGQSLVMDFPILTNASLPVIGRAALVGLVRRQRELALVEPHLRRLRLRFRSYQQPVATLSGGNQQKVVLAKWLATNPQLLILDEPTQGIDVQTKAEVHAMMVSLARQGLAIVLISSELPELVGMCDRVVVLREGCITARLAGDEIGQEQIIRAATDAEPVDPTAGAASLRPARQEDRARPRPVAIQREVGLLCAILLVALPVMALNPRMLSGANLKAIATDAALLVIAAVAQMLVLLTRNIDLSIASVIGLAAYGSANFMHLHPAVPVLAGVAVGAAIGAICGAINALIVTAGRLPSIVITLGTLSIYRGLNSLWAAGKQISADQVPQRWLDLTSTRLFGIPALVLIALVTVTTIALALHHKAPGRELYAVGSNPEGAALIGLRRTMLVSAAFVIAGVLVGFDGAMWASRYATIDARVATGYELTVIAAAVVGGVAIRGGAGTVLGVSLGALTLLVIQNGLTLVRVDPLWLQGAYGLVILLAVGVDALVARRVTTTGPRR